MEFPLILSDIYILVLKRTELEHCIFILRASHEKGLLQHL